MEVGMLQGMRDTLPLELAVVHVCKFVVAVEAGEATEEVMAEEEEMIVVMKAVVAEEENMVEAEVDQMVW